jgi:hypothetical protein
MDPKAIAQQVLARVEQETRRPVGVEQDRSLTVLSAVRVARGPAPMHVIRYNPATVSEPEYVICYQCGFILRLFANPPSARFDLAATKTGHEEVDRLVAKGRPSVLPAAALRQFRNNLLDGILTQLRSYPIGLRVDAWIAEAFPALAPLQRASVTWQLQQNMAVLQPEVARLTAEKVYRASVGMNAAFAAYWSEGFGQPQLTVPYKATQYLGLAEQLLEAWRAIPKEPTHDQQLVDAWADRLGLKGWYAWVPYPETA